MAGKGDKWITRDMIINYFLPQQFGRDLRAFAQKERQMLLDNHALYDKTKVLCVLSLQCN